MDVQNDVVKEILEDDDVVVVESTLLSAVTNENVSADCIGKIESLPAIESIAIPENPEQHQEAVDALEKESDDQQRAVSTEISESSPPGSAKLSSFVIPLRSPRMPTLAYKTMTPTKVADKEIKPTVVPSAVPGAGDSVFKLLTYSKSISSALAPPKPPPEKRKHMGGCCNANCSRNSDELFAAPKHAILYFHFNTSLKKVYKICSHCLADADRYITVSSSLI